MQALLDTVLCNFWVFPNNKMTTKVINSGHQDSYSNTVKNIYERGPQKCFRKFQ